MLSHKVKCYLEPMKHYWKNRISLMVNTLTGNYKKPAGKWKIISLCVYREGVTDKKNNNLSIGFFISNGLWFSFVREIPRHQTWSFFFCRWNPKGKLLALINREKKFPYLHSTISKTGIFPVDSLTNRVIYLLWAVLPHFPVFIWPIEKWNAYI